MRLPHHPHWRLSPMEGGWEQYEIGNWGDKPYLSVDLNTLTGRWILWYNYHKYRFTELQASMLLQHSAADALALVFNRLESLKDQELR